MIFSYCFLDSGYIDLPFYYYCILGCILAPVITRTDTTGQILRVIPYFLVHLPTHTNNNFNNSPATLEEEKDHCCQA